MDKDDFVLEMEKRFSSYLNSNDEDTVDFTDWFINGSQQYQIEKEARRFLQNNPDPSPRELMDFFITTCPGGLAPGDDGLDLLE